MDHYLTRLQNATRKYWNKSALNTLGGESFTYSQMATLIEKFHIFFDKAGLQKGSTSPSGPATAPAGACPIWP